MKNIPVAIILILFIQLIRPSILKCQDNSNKTSSIYLEIGGNNIYYSVNYEKEILSNFSPRLAFSILPYSEATNSGKHSNSTLFLSLMSNYFINLSNNVKTEMGAGVSYGFGTVFPAISLGLRYSPTNKPVFFKLTFTPFLNKEIFGAFPWFGLGFGIRY